MQPDLAILPRLLCNWKSEHTMWKQICAIALVVMTMSTDAALAETRQVTGSVTYRERIALPPGALLEVSLLDMSRQDVVAKVISSDSIEMSGVPTEFSLPYDSEAISDALSYSVRAQITLSGKLLYTSTTANPVLTRGAGDHVDIIVQRVASQTSILGTSWVVEQVGGETVTLDRPQTIQFGQDGSLAVFGGCNQFMGSYDNNDGRFALSRGMAGTLMACPEAINVLETQFIDLLQQAERIDNDGSILVLSAENGTVLVLARSDG